jgi:glutathione S-transferase
MTDDTVTLYHAPRTRSSGVRILLDELGAPHELKILNLKLKEQFAPEYLALNPLGKVPTIVHKGAVVTEQTAIYPYLADVFPQKGLAPPIGDSLRGPYLRWIAIYGAAFEPAMIDHAQKRVSEPRAMSPYGSYEEIVGLVRGQLAKGPFLFGERFTAADFLWGTALRWMVVFGLLESTPEVASYVERIGSRESVHRVGKSDHDIAEAQAAAVAAATPG